MRVSWTAGFGLLFITGMLISATMEGLYMSSDTSNIFYQVMNPDFGSFTNPLTAVGGFFIMVWVWIQALWAIFWWDYSFLSGSWEILRYFGWAVSLAMVVSIVLAVRGTSSA